MSQGSALGWLNTDALAPLFAGFVENIRPIAPDVLAESAAGLTDVSARASLLLESFWLSPTAVPDQEEPGDGTPAERCLAWLFLQPCAEYLCADRSPQPSDGSSTRCPQCGSRPLVGVLRPEGDGAKKSLICMLCAHEWGFRRIGCPACGETREPQMAFYSAPEFAHVRVDVCDTCRTYLKSVNLAKTGLAVPVVDELAAMPLDLWARENGYRKLHINLAGI